MLPESLKDALIAHMAAVRLLYEKDREKNLPGVYLPGALERKYPGAGIEWGWFWLFPSQTLSVDPYTHTVRRHHMHPASLQKAFKAALIQAGITKQASVHTLRHSSQPTFWKTATTFAPFRNFSAMQIFRLL